MVKADQGWTEEEPQPAGLEAESTASGVAELGFSSLLWISEFELTGSRT